MREERTADDPTYDGALRLVLLTGIAAVGLIGFGYWLGTRRIGAPAPTVTGLGGWTPPAPVVLAPPALAPPMPADLEVPVLSPAPPLRPMTRAYEVSATPVRILSGTPRTSPRRVVISATQPIRVSTSRDIGFAPGGGMLCGPSTPPLDLGLLAPDAVLYAVRAPGGSDATVSVTTFES